MPTWPDGGGEGAMESALQWMVGIFYGPVGTTIAVLAIALLGALMLQGRMPVKRGVQMVLGLFLFFGGASLAEVFVGQAPGRSVAAMSSDDEIPPPVTDNSNVFDPYAGAATGRPER